MQLKSISLKNIRSYSDLNMNFQSGSTLLSGDIGCGKTTILISIEFALFGLMKGMLTGSSLLRNSAKEGSVTLTFSEGPNTFCISRSLKRTSSGIAQDTGYLEINGERKEYTSVELKSRILSILGYPDELLTKSKSLIYRYTVYTPQEDMKKIIFDSEEERLEKLTKIFNVEKYKRIRENAESYAKELRAETKIMAMLETELASLKTFQKTYESGMEDKNILLQQIIADVNTEEKILKISEDKIKSMDEAVRTLATLKQELNILSIEKNNLTKNLGTLRNDILSLEAQKNRLSEEHKTNNEDSPQLRKKEEAELDLVKFRDLKQKTEAQVIDAKSRIMTAEKRIAENEKMKNDIHMLTKCPTCQQEVDEKHKHKISDDEDLMIRELLQKKEQYVLVLEKAEKNKKIINSKIESIEKEISDIRSAEQKINFRRQQETILREAEEKIIKTKDRIKKFEEELVSNEEFTLKLKEKISDSLIDEKAMQEVNADFKKSKEKHLMLKMKEASITQSISETIKLLENNSEEQQKKNAQIDRVLQKKNLEHWISNHFINLVEVIEKNVMSSIRAEFKEHFEEWFNMLIEDENITATLDERFTPVVRANGYDTEIENLSGGEKTSVALAYRLALNKVINSMISTIQTKDILILDEPTDGFSSHQLDKVRDVLEALNSKQTIIVSHESKMESFVDHVIKLRKHENASEIIIS